MYKPILFNTNMVQAIRSGLKTCTRRVIKGMPESTHCVFNSVDDDRCMDFLYGCYYAPDKTFFDMCYSAKAPFWPGDILWVRETWRIQSASRYEASAKIEYRAGGDLQKIYFPHGNTDSINRDEYDSFTDQWCGEKWRPSIFMPREAARIFLRVTDVHAERLQSITPNGIDAEGCKEYAYDAKTGALLPSSPIWFKIVWDKTVQKADLSKYGWDANPWVWVISFEVVERPADFNSSTRHTRKGRRFYG